MFYTVMIIMLLLQSDFLSIVYSCWKKNKAGGKYGKNRTTTTPATTENSTINLENFLVDKNDTKQDEKIQDLLNTV